ncbi:MAG: hypothetical protein NZ765_09665 [Anaerolineae bacterium]|nr:hypothetical protein [Anaerolineae bacterium]MDW8071383.1 hypothetical protein [Anaerolineae bacterium]
MGAEEKRNPEPKEARASRLTCADCAVDIDKLLAEIEEDGSAVDKRSHLVFDVSQLSVETSSRPPETAEHAAGGEQS